MSDVLDRVQELRQDVEEATRTRIRYEAERDAATAHRDEALAALKRFGVETVADAEVLLKEKEAEIAEEIAAIQEALG